MKKYKVEFTGFAYVESENEEEAKDMYFDGLSAYEEVSISKVAEVDEFIIT